MIRHNLQWALVAFILAIPLIHTAAQDVDPNKQQEFADDLTALLYTKENEFSSALGVSMAFSLIWPGCTGDAIEQVRQTLGYPEDGSNLRLVWEETTQSMLNGANGQCLYEYDGVCESVAPLLKIANSIWFDDGDVLNTTYESVVGDYAMQTDFEAEDSPVVVNEWVKNSTNGLIDSIVPEGQPLFPPLVLIAINSIYLKASWSAQFEKSNTNLDSFYSSASRSTEVAKAHFMHQVEYFAYSHDALSGFQVVVLPLANSQMSVIFVLPMTDEAGNVTSTDLIFILDTLPSTRVALSLPKFKFESQYDDGLQDALIQLGIVSPFAEGTGALCGLFNSSENCENLIIDEIIQKTVVDVNEEGIEAAAVTAIMVGLTSVPTDNPFLVVLDHPFQFFIYDGDEELMLFEGRLGMTEVPETEPEVPLLDAVHSDSDFWTSFGVNPVDPVPPVDATTNSTATSDIESQLTSSTSSNPSFQPTGSSTDSTEIESQSTTSSTTSMPSPKPSTSNTVETVVTSAPNQPASSTATSTPTSQPVGTSGNSKVSVSALTCICLACAMSVVW